MTRVRVPALVPQGQRLVLDREASKHLVQVLRLREGEALVVFDGLGSEADAALERADRGAAVVAVTSPPRERRPVHALHLLLGVPKGPAMDLAVRMATEAGMTHLHPVHTKRAVPRSEKVDRWERIAVSAAEQCGRADVPVVLPPASLIDAIHRLDGVPDRRVALPGAPACPAASGPAAVLVGPEGGLTDAEVRLAEETGFRPAGLGRFVLRACTAAAVAVATTSGT